MEAAAHLLGAASGGLVAPVGAWALLMPRAGGLVGLVMVRLYEHVLSLAQQRSEVRERVAEKHDVLANVRARAGAKSRAGAAARTGVQGSGSGLGLG